MKKSCITFGNWNKRYLYIIGSFISVIIYKIITGYSYYEYKFLYTLGEDAKDISGHLYIHQCFYYFIIFIFSFLFHLYEERKEQKYKKKKKDIFDKIQDEKLIENNNNQDLIYNDIYEYQAENQKISDIFAFIIIFLYVLVEQALHTFKRYFVNCDFWMFELIIMAVFNKKMFKINIYKHQLIALFLVTIPAILKLATIILLFYDENNRGNYINGIINYKYNDKINELKVLFVVHSYLLPISTIIYLLLIILKAYLLISIKKIMDLKYVSLSKILICYGGFGTFLLLIVSISASFLPCETRNKINENFYGLSDYGCRVISEENNGNIETFVENVFSLLEGKIWKHCLIILFGGIAYGSYKLFVFQIVQYLTPIHASFSLPIYYFLEKLFLLNNIIGKSSMKYTNIIFCIDLSSDLSAIIEFLIYLEIIELNFCGFNKNLRKNIIKRGKIDFKQNRSSSINDSLNESDFSENEANLSNTINSITIYE